MKTSIAVLLSGLVLGQTVPYVRTKTDDGAHCLRWPVNAGARGTIHFVQSSTGDPGLIIIAGRTIVQRIPPRFTRSSAAFFDCA